MAAERETWDTHDHFAQRIAALLGAGTISPPYHRRARTFFTRREPGQQFAVLYATDSQDGQPRVLFDPSAHDPTGKTTLDSWQPSKEGDRIAYQLSEGGDEESHLYVMDVATTQVIDGPIDRCRYSPVAWLPGGAAFYFVRRLDPTLLPETEQAFHRRVYLHRVATDPAQDALIFGAGMTMTNYYGVEVSCDGRWLQVSASEGTEPRNNLWVADLSGADPRFPAFRLVQADVDAQTGLTFGRDGRVYVFTDLDAERGEYRVARLCKGLCEVAAAAFVVCVAEVVAENLNGLDGGEVVVEADLACIQPGSGGDDLEGRARGLWGGITEPGNRLYGAGASVQQYGAAVDAFHGAHNRVL
jgi:prolyl oligopeptidase